LLGNTDVKDFIWTTLVFEDWGLISNFEDCNIVIVVLVSSGNMGTILGDGNSRDGSGLLTKSNSGDLLSGCCIPNEDWWVLSNLTCNG